MKPLRFLNAPGLCAAVAVLLTSGCAGTADEALGPPRTETVYAVTDQAELIRFNAGQYFPIQV